MSLALVGLYTRIRDRNPSHFWRIVARQVFLLTRRPIDNLDEVCLKDVRQARNDHRRRSDCIIRLSDNCLI